MVGRTRGYVTTPGQILADLFKEAGYPVISSSSHLNRYLRLADIVSVLFRERRHIDILLLNVYSGLSFVVEDIASRIAQHFDCPMIMYLHGGAMPEFMESFPRWSSRVLKRADFLIAPSEFLVRALSQHGLQARIIPNVIELEAYPFRKRSQLRPRLFWMRSFHSIYNPEMALRVLARLRMKFPDATLVMAGQDKGLLGAMKRLARELGVEEALRFPGFLDPAAKVCEYAAADIFINTNRIDNMPVAVLEAGAMGLPIVSTKVGGITDLLTDGQTGLIVPDGDAEAMAQAIAHLIADPQLAERISENGRKLVERCSWACVRPQWENLFEELMAKHNKQKKERV